MISERENKVGLSWLQIVKFTTMMMMMMMATGALPRSWSSSLSCIQSCPLRAEVSPALISVNTDHFVRCAPSRPPECEARRSHDAETSPHVSCLWSHGFVSLNLLQRNCKSRQFWWKLFFLLTRSRNVYRAHSVIVLSSWCHATHVTVSALLITTYLLVNKHHFHEFFLASNKRKVAVAPKQHFMKVYRDLKVKLHVF